MEGRLPIPARPIGALVRTLRQGGVKLDRNRELQVKRVFYGGDEGGILCDVTTPDMIKMPIICSLTHLRVSAKHALGQEIRAYQRERANKPCRSGREPTSFPVNPQRGRRTKS